MRHLVWKSKIDFYGWDTPPRLFLRIATGFRVDHNDMERNGYLDSGTPRDSSNPEALSGV
jgi:hypothetical protein